MYSIRTNLARENRSFSKSRLCLLRRHVWRNLGKRMHLASRTVAVDNILPFWERTSTSGPAVEPAQLTFQPRDREAHRLRSDGINDGFTRGLAC